MTEIGQYHDRMVREIDRVIGSVRGALGRIDATGALTCDPVDVALRSEAVLSVPGLKAIALVTPDGLHTCGSPSYKFAAIVGDAIEPEGLSDVERFDIVKLADNGPLAFRLQRRPAGASVTIRQSYRSRMCSASVRRTRPVKSRAPGHV